MDYFLTDADMAKPFPDITDEDWLRFFEVNVLSGVRLSRFYLPKMLKNNWEGSSSFPVNPA